MGIIDKIRIFFFKLNHSEKVDGPYDYYEYDTKNNIVVCSNADFRDSKDINLDISSLIVQIGKDDIDTLSRLCTYGKYINTNNENCVLLTIEDIVNSLLLHDIDTNMIFADLLEDNSLLEPLDRDAILDKLFINDLLYTPYYYTTIEEKDKYTIYFPNVDYINYYFRETTNKDIYFDNIHVKIYLYNVPMFVLLEANYIDDKIMKFDVNEEPVVDNKTYSFSFEGKSYTMTGTQAIYSILNMSKSFGDAYFMNMSTLPMGKSINVKLSISLPSLLTYLDTYRTHYLGKILRDIVFNNDLLTDEEIKNRSLNKLTNDEIKEKEYEEIDDIIEEKYID